MGYRGKVELQEKARLLRAEGRTLADIASTLAVAKSSVSLRVRDVEFEARPRRYRGRRREPNVLQRRKAAEIEAMNRLGVDRLGTLNRQAFLAAGAALYAGEGSKRDGVVCFANTDAEMIRFFCCWLRQFFEIDESRLRAKVYLHAGLDLDAAERYWSQVSGVPRPQFSAPYRAVPRATIRHNKHEHGCFYVIYSCSRTHRAIMGVVSALVASRPTIPG